MDNDQERRLNPSQKGYEDLYTAEGTAANAPLQNPASENPDLDSDPSADSQSAEHPGWETNVTNPQSSSASQSPAKTSPGGLKGLLRKHAPLMLILAILFGGGGFMILSPITQPFAIVNRLIQENNTLGTVNAKQSNFLIRHMLRAATPKIDGDTADDAIKGTVFDYDNFKLGKTQRADFKNNGMQIVDTNLSDGTKIRYLSYDDNGTTRVIAADADSVKKLKGSNIKGATDAVDLNTAKAEIPDFNNKFVSATATYSGQNGGWYDTIIGKMLQRLGLSRNRFSGYQNTDNIETNNKQFRDLASTDAEQKGNKIIDTGEEKVTTVDENGKTVEVTETTTNIDSAQNENPVKTDTPEQIKSKLATKFTRTANLGVNAGCAIMTVASSINNIANAAEKIQILNFATGFNEAVQKTQVEGKGAPMYAYMDRLNKPDANGSSGMNAAGMVLTFGGSVANLSSDESVKKYNFENSYHELFNSGITLKDASMEAVRNCSYLRIAASVTDLAVSTAAIALAPVTGGISLSAIVFKTALSAGVAFAVTQIIDTLVPRVAAMITRDLITDIAGPDVGNALVAGDELYKYSNHKFHGGTGGDAATYAAFNKVTQEVIAEEAEYERANKSPFDPTSPYTFFGALYGNLLTTFSSLSTPTKLLSSLSSSLSASMNKILPTASALDNTNLTYKKGNCPISEEDTGAWSNFYCITPTVSDPSTMQMDPADVFLTVKNLGGFKTDITGKVVTSSDGNPVIDTKSELGKYIGFCTQRQTSYGQADASILGAIVQPSTGSTAADSIINGAINAIDEVDDAVTIIQAAIQNHNEGWISGLYCLASSKNPRWNEMKYYQRYLEQQHTLEGMGVVKRSSLDLALDEWYEEHPIDNSYAGQLAYFSGYTKAEVELTLDFIERQNLLAEYHPQNMAPLPLEAPAITVLNLLFDTDNFTFIKMQQPLVAGTSELERQISLRENKRSINQSI